MGTASRVVSVVARLGQLTSSVIVLGIVGHFVSIVDNANASADARLVYTLVVTSISVVLSLLLLPPFTYSFMAFPLDFVMFVLALVAFCLLETLTGTNTCSASWYWSYWGYYWGGFWRTPTIVLNGPSDINNAGCGSWRAVLAWTFILSMAFLFSSFVGAYVILNYREEKKRAHSISKALPMVHTKTPQTQVQVQPVSGGATGSPTFPV